MKRYDQVLMAIDQVKPSRIVEVGTWNGERALLMAKRALQHSQQVYYLGFDLFEEGSADLDARELNVKARSTMAEVFAKLEALRVENPNFDFGLVMGDTRITMAEVDFSEIDFAWVDGGHSVETIASDLKFLEGVPVVLADDYYLPDDEGKIPDITKYGCNLAVDGDDRWKVIGVKDAVKGGGCVRMAARGWMPRVNFAVKTRNCVDDSEIQGNVAHALTLGLPFLPICHPHDQRAIMVSAGPKMVDHLDEIRAEQAAGGKIICVKHSHDVLIANGIRPWACVLLDPRGHVRDFLDDPQPDVYYLVASMCHPTTFARLLERKAHAVVYNAHVGAGEEKMLVPGSFMIGGGSSSSIRGMSVAHALGFRRFIMYGYDSCFWEKPDMDEKLPDGQQRFYELEVNGRRFWTDAELAAQGQDFAKLMTDAHYWDVEARGDGIIPHIWRTNQPRKARFAEAIPDLARYG